MGVSYVFADTDGPDLANAINALGWTFGIEILLMESGAAINGSFSQAQLIDEISVLIGAAVNSVAGVHCMSRTRIFAVEWSGRPSEGGRPKSDRCRRPH